MTLLHHERKRVSGDDSGAKASSPQHVFRTEAEVLARIAGVIVADVREG